MAARQRVPVPGFIFVVLLLQCTLASASWQYADPARYPDVPSYGPQPAAPYMVDNTHNYYHVAPDKGKQNGPIWPYSGSFQNYITNLKHDKVSRGGYSNFTKNFLANETEHKIKQRQTSAATSYWLPYLAIHGKAPLAGSTNYTVFRNVVDDYHADNGGTSDASEAINAAVSDGNRCGETCGNSFTTPAIIYFPSGKYKICSPIVQLYFTQFIGDATDPPTIIGCENFTGIALFDTDPYIPGGSGAEWYVDTNQFFRQIRNFIFDLTQMPSTNQDAGQSYYPLGIHWQVAQATSLQNLVFNMPTATSDNNVTTVGIFTENGSGGFVSDLTFNGGNIGWRAGSQQYTARGLQFNGCLTAVQMVWDWGWTWQGISITGGAIAFNISGVGGDTGQGTGSVSILDSTISNVPVGVLTNAGSSSPYVVIDNVVFDNVEYAVQVDGGSTLLTATGTVDLWTTGRVYNGSSGVDVTGTTTVPPKAPVLLASGGSLYTQSRPQYETYASSSFLVATTDGGCLNDGTGDQTSCLNEFLQKAVSSTLIAFFPAGIYQVGGTVLIPTGSRVQGSAWSQIQGSGYYFSDMLHPKVVVQVGNAGDVGTMEIVEMLFSVRGNTAGAILMEWNTAAESQGAAAMWDSHFRVGGATGSDLDFSNCPKRGFNDQCIAATLMFRVTKQASGYFENVWAWVADHDNDDSLYNNPDPMGNQVSIYGARGMLIESQGPSWFVGTSCEHSVLYNYQLSGAQNIYMGHIQTETAYYQPNPIAPQPFNVAASFPNDPDFSTCDPNDPSCAATWGLRVVDSSAVTIHGAGLYSFFQDYYEDCLATFNCQDRILEVVGSTGVVVYNLYTVGTADVAVGIDGTVVYQNDSNQRGFTTEDSVWLPLPGADNIDTVFLGTEIWSSTTATCSASSCLLVFPTSSLPSSSVITVGNYTTSLEYGGTSTVTTGGVVTVTFVTTTTTTVLPVPPITIGGMSYSNYNATSGQTSFIVSESVDVPPITIGVPNSVGSPTPRVVPLPPWPDIINGGPGPTSIGVTGTGGTTSTYYTGLTSTVTVTGSTVTTISFPATIPPTTVTCPPESTIVFATPSITVSTDCTALTTWAVGFDCPTTKVVTFLAATTGVVSVDCSLVTLWSASPTTTGPTSTTTTPLPIWATWPPGAIIPITTTVTTPEPTGGGTKQPCTLWFFFICISHDQLHIGGWYWTFPPGIYPPGPPPGIEWPPGFTLKGSLPPWPPITIGEDGQLTYDEEPTSCRTETANLCSTTTTFLATSSGDTVTTTATSTSSDCETVTGCSLSNSNTGVQTTVVASCAPASVVAPQRRRARSAAAAEPTAAAEEEAAEEEEERSVLEARANGCNLNDYIVYPSDPFNVGDIPMYLANAGVTFNQIQSTNLGYTAYYWLQSPSQDLLDTLAADADVLGEPYEYYAYNERTLNTGRPILFGMSGGDAAPALEARRHREDDLLQSSRPPPNATQVDAPEPDRVTLWKRFATSAVSEYWDDALVSLPDGAGWKSAASQSFSGGQFQYFYDSSAGAGVTVYAIGEVGVYTNHPEFANNVPRALPVQSSYGYTGVANADLSLHGSQVAGVINGLKLGVSKDASVVYSGHPIPADDNNSPRDWFLEDLLSAWDDMNTGGRTPAGSVINMSFGSKFNFWTTNFIKRFYDILKRMDRAGVTIVVSAGNWGKTPAIPGGGQSTWRTAVDTYPQLFAKPDNPDAIVFRDFDDEDDLGYLPNMIVVGATTQFGKAAVFTQGLPDPFVSVFAAGQDVWTVNDPAEENQYLTARGTSFAAPQVAALAAYFKNLPLSINWNSQLNQANTNGPKAVKALIEGLQRIIVTNVGSGPGILQIWNGMVQGTNCLTTFPNGGGPNNACPELPADLTDTTPPSCNIGGPLAKRSGPALDEAEEEAEAAAAWGGNATMLLFDKRQDPFACGGGDGGDGVTVSFTTGSTPGPTCPSSCGGFVCEGYWCAPTPTGVPPGYQDPSDPNSAGATASTTTITQGFGGGGGTTPPTSVPPTSVPPTSVPPTSTPPVTTGIAVAAYTICQIEVCEYQWEIFTIQTTTNGFPGCSTDGARYSSVVTDDPSPTDIPRLGPFDIDGRTGCYFDDSLPGVTCVDGSRQDCLNCHPDDPLNGICVGDDVSCDEDENESYNAEWYCWWY